MTDTLLLNSQMWDGTQHYVISWYLERHNKTKCIAIYNNIGTSYYIKNLSWCRYNLINPHMNTTFLLDKLTDSHLVLHKIGTLFQNWNMDSWILVKLITQRKTVFTYSQLLMAIVFSILYSNFVNSMWHMTRTANWSISRVNYRLWYIL